MDLTKFLERIAFSPLFKPLEFLSGNSFAQALLSYNLHITQHLMGIGSGTTVSNSGEHSVVKKLTESVNPPYCIFDVGANKGDFTKMVLSMIPERMLDIHLFEPSTHTFQLLCKNISQHRDIHFNNIGLGREDSDATLYYDDFGSELASLTKRNMSHEDKSFEKSELVHISTIDNYCTSNNIDRVDLLKLDVEGHEIDVLCGAREMFGRNAINLISFEFGAPDIDTRTFFRDLFLFFQDNDMTVFRITRSGYFCQISEYHEKHEQFRTTNFLALKTSAN